MFLAVMLVSLGLLAQQKANVTITEWDTPTKDSHPHDPLAAADGSLWYTGQYANKLGRLDFKTGEIQEWALKTPNSGPHGLIEDKQGSIWFTANSAAYVGKLNPKTSDARSTHPAV
jgi:virginiamycin B lyase